MPNSATPTEPVTEDVTEDDEALAAAREWLAAMASAGQSPDDRPQPQPPRIPRD
jgi:hypothetical protein